MKPSIKEGPAPDAGPVPDREEAEEPEAGEGDSESIRSSPLVRRIAREHGVELSALSGRGTGAGGRITKSDILSFIEQGGAAQPRKETRPKEPAPAMQSGVDVERVPLTPIRKAIAEHMTLSRKTSAHVTTIFEVDVTRVLQARENLKPEYERAGVKLTVTPFFIQAAVNAIKKFPILNSSLEQDAIVYKRRVNIGIAVDIDGGLIVPIRPPY